MLRFACHPCTKEEERFGNGKTERASFFGERLGWLSLPMDLVKGAGITGSGFEILDPWERAKWGGYAKIEKSRLPR